MDVNNSHLAKDGTMDSREKTCLHTFACTSKEIPPMSQVYF